MTLLDGADTIYISGMKWDVLLPDTYTNQKEKLQTCELPRQRDRHGP